MKNTLNTIQVMAKIGKIISKIVYIACLVGAIVCAVAVAITAGAEGFRIAGKDMSDFIIGEGEIVMETAIFECIAGLITCTAQCVLSKFALGYFENELRAGTPFTYEGSKEILRLGILTVAIPIAAAVVSGIAYGIFTAFFPEAAKPQLNSDVSVSMGIMFIMASLIFRHGAEISEQSSCK